MTTYMNRADMDFIVNALGNLDIRNLVRTNDGYTSTIEYDQWEDGEPFHVKLTLVASAIT